MGSVAQERARAAGLSSVSRILRVSRAGVARARHACGVPRHRAEAELEGDDMAHVTVEVPDDEILGLIKRLRGLEPGKTSGRTKVRIEPVPPVSNSTVSHIVTVELSYGMQLGELDELIRA